MHKFITPTTLIACTTSLLTAGQSGTFPPNPLCLYLPPSRPPTCHVFVLVRPAAHADALDAQRAGHPLSLAALKAAGAEVKALWLGSAWVFGGVWRLFWRSGRRMD